MIVNDTARQMFPGIKKSADFPKNHCQYIVAADQNNEKMPCNPATCIV